ncbi:hypothetical protein BDY21DRAFT_337973 [Lineolata rhizophorae]|uniref:Uncharacterized protein n=1 Tax=Lineolata rhizophorae TaxID=578093 RepID=A0A6A6P672_9PEZI|nr:hypothetical protein BDY21DRAFT_337973 [Lineolata rhizophorae]
MLRRAFKSHPLGYLLHSEIIRTPSVHDERINNWQERGRVGGGRHSVVRAARNCISGEIGVAKITMWDCGSVTPGASNRNIIPSWYTKGLFRGSAGSAVTNEIAVLRKLEDLRCVSTVYRSQPFIEFSASFKRDHILLPAIIAFRPPCEAARLQDTQRIWGAPSSCQ